MNVDGYTESEGSAASPAPPVTQPLCAHIICLPLKVDRGAEVYYEWCSTKLSDGRGVGNAGYTGSCKMK